MSLVSGNIDINVILSFAFGLIFISVMLGFSVFFPNPTPLQLRVFITTLALAAAGVGAIFPGFLDIDFMPVARAGGALGLFLVVYLLRPTIEKTVPDFKEPTVPPDPVADQYLTFIDAGLVKEAWDAMDPIARERLVPKFDRMEQIYRATRTPLGRTEIRTSIGTDVLTNPSGHPLGLYRILAYRTKFANLTDCRRETVALRATQDLRWRVYTHQIEQTPIPCI